MSLNSTPSGERVHIAFFGMRNAGKSTLINAVTGQELAVVSDVPGTTTDPVSKAMELLPLGPVMLTDTPGIDDSGELGGLRVKKTRQTLNKTDIAVLVTASETLSPEENGLISLFRAKDIAFVIAHNKSDLTGAKPEKDGEIWVSAKDGTNIGRLKEMLGAMAPKDDDKPIIRDMLEPEDAVVLVVPIDESAPKGRLILPQQQTIRDILDAGATALVTKDDTLRSALASLKSPPRMVVTDSQAFRSVAADTPDEVPLTSFSILMARHKGFLDAAVRGVTAIDRLRDGDTVLISEGCTHHRQCGDIGTVKIPNWLRKRTGKDIKIETSSGGGWPEDLSGYAAVIHCGGCMLSSREMRYRMQCAEDAGVPFTNYGITIAYVNGILRRSITPFPELLREYDSLGGK
ncbi:MAG: [FeFe] hydrogenase H-cluster maturation GTPase HydF [Clostridiales bacterium]|nr:[FeFe] hydrogenase H-cluster maturation GTPase HydF [Clostridiales bacterium]